MGPYCMAMHVILQAMYNTASTSLPWAARSDDPAAPPRDRVLTALLGSTPALLWLHGELAEGTKSAEN